MSALPGHTALAVVGGHQDGATFIAVFWDILNLVLKMRNVLCWLKYKQNDCLPNTEQGYVLADDESASQPASHCYQVATEAIWI